jgi:DNA-binding LytR/AlgR family response regulator
MRIAICEDENYWVEAMKASVYQWASMRNIDLHCDVFFSPKELIKHLSVCKDTDVLFLDISLGSEVIDGVAAAKYIRKMGNEIPIIFITADSMRAADGYLVEAIGFLGKPIDEERLTLFLNRIVKQQKNNRVIKIVTENNIINVWQKDMLYAEVNNHTITFHTTKTRISQRGTLGDIFEILGNEHFVQIHRSYVISKEKIHSIKSTYPYSVDLLAGDHIISLPVSRNHIKGLLEIYSDNLLEKMI